MLHPAPIIDAALSLALGAALGLVYDILRPPRRAMKKCGFMLDLLFCALAARGAFSLAMHNADGRFGLWAVAAGSAGFLLWLALASPLAAPFFLRLWTSVAKGVKKAVKIAKKSIKSANFLFAKLRSRYIISVKKAQGEPR